MTSETDTEAVDDDHTSPIEVSQSRRGLRWLIEWALILSVAFIVAVGFRTYVAQTFYIPSLSMYPSLHVGDRIIVSKLSVSLGTIHRGDVVVFRAPSDVAQRCDGSPETYLVKRVIGLPGDQLHSIESAIFFKTPGDVQWHKLNEWWQHSKNFGEPIGEVTVPKDSYFMMGDNNYASCDSRYWGSVRHSALIGKVMFRIWPLGRLGSL